MVGAVIVLFNPDFAQLEKGINALSSQVDAIIIIDNSSIDNSEQLSKLITQNDIVYIPLKENKGIAYAQNVGIRELYKRNADFVIFSDQDSVCQPGLVNFMTNAHQVLSKKFNIAVLGPIPFNSKYEREYINKNNILETSEFEGIKYETTESVISSFSLISMDVFEKIGLYNEFLFTIVR